MAAWPGVVGYLLDLLPTLWPDVDVYDGAPNVAALPPDYASVAFVADDAAGTFTQAREHDYLVVEEGLVRFDITCQTGDAVLTDVRSRVFGLFDSLDAHVRADQTLGGLVFGPVLLAAADVLTISNKNGVAMSLACSLTYRTEAPSPQ